MKEKADVVVDKKILKEVNKLLRKNNRLSVAFEKAKEKLRDKPGMGDYIPRGQWPKKIVKEYHPTNLYKYDMYKKTSWLENGLYYYT